MKSFFYNGRTFEYDDETYFILQTGRYKNSYITKGIYGSNLSNAIEHYESFRIANGYKKRLAMQNGINITVIAREISER